MSTGEKRQILDYLPPQERQKLLTLVQRLQQETEAKNKYCELYQQSQGALDALTLKYNQLKDENKLLKQQIHNSFSIVSQVRANFQANRHKRNLPADPQHNWRDSQEHSDQENQPTSSNHAPPQHLKTPIDKYRPPQSGKKALLDLSAQDESSRIQLSNSRSREITDLKREIRNMQEEKRREEEKKQSLKEKHRLVDQIKSRYRGDESTRKSQEADESRIERIDVTHTFADEEKQSKSQERHPKSQEKAFPIDNKRLRPPLKSEEQREAKAKERDLRVKQDRELKAKASRVKSPLKGHVMTAADYDDVLDLINCHNL